MGTHYPGLVFSLERSPRSAAMRSPWVLNCHRPGPEDMNRGCLEGTVLTYRGKALLVGPLGPSSSFTMEQRERQFILFL